MPAKIPESLVKPAMPVYTIETLPVGAEFGFSSSAMLVDEDGTCYLQPDFETGWSEFIMVKHDERGYHVHVQMPGIQWVRAAIEPEKKSTLIPVESLTVAEL